MPCAGWNCWRQPARSSTAADRSSASASVTRPSSNGARNSTPARPASACSPAPWSGSHPTRSQGPPDRLEPTRNRPHRLPALPRHPRRQPRLLRPQLLPRPTDPSIVATWTDYGGRFASSVWRDNVFATQFHPRKARPSVLPSCVISSAWQPESRAASGLDGLTETCAATPRSPRLAPRLVPPSLHPLADQQDGSGIRITGLVGPPETRQAGTEIAEQQVGPASAPS